MTWYEIVYIAVQLLAVASWVALPFGLWLIKKVKVKKIFLGVVLFINASLAGMMLQVESEVPQPNVVPQRGDFWNIETVFKTDTDIASRAWKRNILSELLENLNTHRAAQNLDLITPSTVESFSPEQLQALMESNPDSVQLLDVREAYERQGYSLANAFNFRYGDLANDEVPALDKSKRVVVICYSGIRGFIVALLLQNLGFEQPSFIRGGLEAWNQAQLPAVGDYESFEFLAQVYERLSLEETQRTSETKIDFRVRAQTSSFTFPNTLLYNGELKTTPQVQRFTNELDLQPVVLLCGTESECYDARNFAYAYQQKGGKILGFYQF